MCRSLWHSDSRTVTVHKCAEVSSNKEVLKLEVFGFISWISWIRKFANARLRRQEFWVRNSDSRRSEWWKELGLWPLLDQQVQVKTSNWFEIGWIQKFLNFFEKFKNFLELNLIKNLVLHWSNFNQNWSFCHRKVFCLVEPAYVSFLLQMNVWNSRARPYETMLSKCLFRLIRLLSEFTTFRNFRKRLCQTLSWKFQISL